MRTATPFVTCSSITLRSDTHCFTKLGAEVTVCAPYTLLPDGFESLGARVETDLDKALDAGYLRL